MSAPSKTYPLPDPTAIAAKVVAAGGPQVDVTKPTGEASADGVTIGWSIADGHITVSVLSKPFYMPLGSIWTHVDNLFA
jgi:hypothetical protein